MNIDVYSNPKITTAINLGILTGGEFYSTQGAASNPNILLDSVFTSKKIQFSYGTFGVEIRRYLNSKNQGFYINGQPQILYLLSAREKNKVQLNSMSNIVEETKDFGYKLNKFNAILIIGGGYELGFTKRISAGISLNVELRPLNGYYNLKSLSFLAAGLTVLKVKYLLY